MQKVVELQRSLAGLSTMVDDAKAENSKIREDNIILKDGECTCNMCAHFIKIILDVTNSVSSATSGNQKGGVRRKRVPQCAGRSVLEVGAVNITDLDQ